MKTPERGAWYTDPYGTEAQERWWDGSKWTQNVRQKPLDAAPPAIRSAAPPDAGPRDSYRSSLDEVVGEDLLLARVGDRRSLTYELATDDRQRVATLRFGGVGEVARIECSAGEWRLLKRGRFGWDLIVEDADGGVVAWYSGRRWHAGGTISLRAGPKLELLKTTMRPWTLQTVTRRQLVMRMHAFASPCRVELTSAAMRVPDAHIAVLTACTVPLLEAQAAPPIPPGP